VIGRDVFGGSCDESIVLAIDDGRDRTESRSTPPVSNVALHPVGPILTQNHVSKQRIAGSAQIFPASTNGLRPGSDARDDRRPLEVGPILGLGRPFPFGLELGAGRLKRVSDRGQFLLMLPALGLVVVLLLVEVVPQLRVLPDQLVVPPCC
jgi:hypothetical protein